MIVTGIILIILQILTLIGPIATQTPITSSGPLAFVELIGYFTFAIIGTILIVVGGKRKEKAESTKEQADPDKENSEDDK